MASPKSSSSVNSYLTAFTVPTTTLLESFPESNPACLHAGMPLNVLVTLRDKGIIGIRLLVQLREGYTAPFPNRASVHEPSSFFFVETTYFVLLLVFSGRGEEGRR